jgi:hypothetical protein
MTINFDTMTDEQTHRYLCHPRGEPCPDGCDAQAHPARLAAYESHYDRKDRSETAQVSS